VLSKFSNISFINPEMFLLLLAIPIYILWKKYRGKQTEIEMIFSSLMNITDVTSWKEILRRVLPFLQVLAFAALVLALARPQLTSKEEEISAEGIDIVMVMDLSSSMLAQDFKPNRLEASKRVASDFVSKREFDRIGLVVFAGEAFTQCPLTTDHTVLKNFMSELQCGYLEDGTAIGMGMATSLNRLKDSEAKSKVMILLTDGVNNSGYVMPLTATEIAQSLEVKVYTIGVGSMGDALAPVRRRSDGRYVFDIARVEMDEDLLQEIAEKTGGKYYRATSQESLERIYDEIDQLEKTEMEITAIKRYSEEFRPFLLFSLISLLIDFLLRHTILRGIP
jgi:Ca-activated chloride channel family protein